jgi:hypothetical protein
VCGKGRGGRQTSQHSTGQIASPVPVAHRLLLQGWEQHKTLRYDARYAGGADACRLCFFALPKPVSEVICRSADILYIHMSRYSSLSYTAITTM